MSKLVSNFSTVGAIKFPEFLGRQVHMHEFNIDNPSMPIGFEDYLEVVNSLCESVSGTAYLTVDEKIVQSGNSHRRGGAHLDGRWMPDLGTHKGGGHVQAGVNNPLIVASSVEGCVAYGGEFEGVPKEDGDLEHIRDQLGKGEVLKCNQGYLLSPDCVHESIPLLHTTKRSFIRIALEDAQDDL